MPITSRRHTRKLRQLLRWNFPRVGLASFRFAIAISAQYYPWLVISPAWASSLCTEGTCRALTAATFLAKVIGRIGSEEPNIGTKIMDGEIDLVINTPFGQETRGDGYQLRTMCVRQNL